MAPDQQTIEAWLTAGRELGVRVISPFVLTASDGESVDCIASLPDYGGKNGMVVFAALRAADLGSKEARAARSSSLYYSFVYAGVYKRYDRARFIDALTDWGYYGPAESRPTWYAPPWEASPCPK